MTHVASSHNAQRLAASGGGVPCGSFARRAAPCYAELCRAIGDSCHTFSHECIHACLFTRTRTLGSAIELPH